MLQRIYDILKWAQLDASHLRVHPAVAVAAIAGLFALAFTLPLVIFALQ